LETLDDLNNILLLRKRKRERKTPAWKPTPAPPPLVVGHLTQPTVVGSAGWASTTLLCSEGCSRRTALMAVLALQLGLKVVLELQMTMNGNLELQLALKVV